ncbi:hypothetical protein KW786_03980 [Candidatus Parcubacteria bacterium]|nr:hypothetical protein [Candidatus Parcubacteria bacterium]
MWKISLMSLRMSGAKDGLKTKWRTFHWTACHLIDESHHRSEDWHEKVDVTSSVWHARPQQVNYSPKDYEVAAELLQRLLERLVAEGKVAEDHQVQMDENWYFREFTGTVRGLIDHDHLAGCEWRSWVE